MLKSMTIDFTSLNLWRTCPQKFAYRTLHSLVAPYESHALDFGKLMHLGVEKLNLFQAAPDPRAYHELEALVSGVPPTTHPLQDNLLSVLNAVATEAATSSVYRLNPEERRSLKHLLLLLIKYCERWNPDPLRTDQCEVKHKMFLGETHSGIKIYYKGTIDGYKESKVIERKTTSYLNTGFINRINPNAQASGYIWLARDLFKDEKINTIVFDAISTSGYGKSEWAKTASPSRWTINTDPNSLFLRAETFRTEEQLAEWKAQVLYDCERIAQDISRGRFSTNQPDACTAYNTTCPYIDVCRASNLQRANLLENTFKVEEWDGFQVNKE